MAVPIHIKPVSTTTHGILFQVYANTRMKTVIFQTHLSSDGTGDWCDCATSELKYDCEHLRKARKIGVDDVTVY